MKAKSLYRFSVSILITAFIFVLIFRPSDISYAVKDALSLCANSVIPSLFPFLAVSNLIISMGVSDFFERHFKKIIRRIFSVSGALTPALMLGLIGGYPVGAAACASAYSSGLCTRDDAERALAFCNNCGPAFILGTIGGGIFSSPKVGTALLIIHITSALTVGFLLRLVNPITPPGVSFKKTVRQKSTSFPTAFTGAVSKALTSVLSISAYIVLFSVLVTATELLQLLPAIGNIAERITGVDAAVYKALISGFLEMTVGAFSLARCSDFTTAFILISFLLGWGGLSVHCQALSFISETGLSVRQYFVGKLLHGGISAIYAYICTRLISFDAAAAFSEIHDTYSEVNIRIVFLFILCLFYFFCKKGWKKVK